MFPPERVIALTIFIALNFILAGHKKKPKLMSVTINERPHKLKVRLLTYQVLLSVVIKVQTGESFLQLITTRKKRQRDSSSLCSDKKRENIHLYFNFWNQCFISR